MKKKFDLEQTRIFFILTLIVFLIYCVMQFFLAWHNLDLIHNIQIMTGTINQAGFYNINGTQIIIPFDKITDTGSDFVSRPLVDYYISSTNDLKTYFVFGLIDCLILGLLLGGKLWQK